MSINTYSDASINTKLLYIRYSNPGESTKVDVLPQKVKVAGPAKRDLISDLPNVILYKVGGMLDGSDIRAVRAVNKHFNVQFTSNVKGESQLLLNQVIGCTSLTSLKTLRRQLQELKLHYPNYLGEGKTWSLAEVLKLYSLETIDLSQEVLTLADIEELMSAFDEIMKTSEPKKTVKIEKQAATFAYEIFTNEELQPRLLELAKSSKLFPESYVFPKAHLLLWETIVCALLREPAVKVAELLHDFRDLIGLQGDVFSAAYEQGIFGSIEVLNLGMNNPTLDFRLIKPFLKGFCPRLKVFSVRSTNHRMVQRFFSTTDRKDTLQYLNSGASMHNDISGALCQLISCQRNLEEALARFPISSYPELTLLADHCPRITTLALNADPLRQRQDEMGMFNAELSKVAQKCPNIEKLVLVHFYELEFVRHFSSVLKQFGNLKELFIFNAVDGNLLLDNITSGSLKRLLSKCPQLRSLSIEGVSPIDLGNCVITDDVINFLPGVLPNLEELTAFSEQRILSDEAILRFVKNSPRLTKLNLRGSRNALSSLFTSIFQLRQLSRRLEDKNLLHRDFLKEFNKLPDPIKRSIYSGIAWHFKKEDGLYGKKLLEEDVFVLKRCTKPYFLYKGNLLEQQCQRTIAAIYKDKYLITDVRSLMNFQTLLDDLNVSDDQIRRVYQLIVGDAMKKNFPQHFYQTRNVSRELVQIFEALIEHNPRLLRHTLERYVSHMREEHHG